MKKGCSFFRQSSQLFAWKSLRTAEGKAEGKADRKSCSFSSAPFSIFPSPFLRKRHEKNRKAKEKSWVENEEKLQLFFRGESCSFSPRKVWKSMKSWIEKLQLFPKSCSFSEVRFSEKAVAFFRKRTRKADGKMEKAEGKS